MSEPEKKTPPLLIVFAWAIVTIPLGWGVYQSVVKSSELFKVSARSHMRTTPNP